MNLLSRKNFDNPKMSQKTAKKFTKFASDQSLQEIILSDTSGGGFVLSHCKSNDWFLYEM